MRDSILTTIGRAEKVDLVELNVCNVPAKVDTGADICSIWASHIEETTEGLKVIFFGEGSKFYTGEKVLIKTGYKITNVYSSFGHKEKRYKMKLAIRVRGRLVRATFSLSDRSTKAYPILLGRRLLTGKFIVDVSHQYVKDLL